VSSSHAIYWRACGTRAAVGRRDVVVAEFLYLFDFDLRSDELGLVGCCRLG